MRSLLRLLTALLLAFALATPTWTADPIPAGTVRLHLDPYWRGDSEAAITAAGRKSKRGGSADIDLNLQPCLDGVVVMHWPDLRRGGWLFIQEGKKRRKLTDDELDRPVKQWRRADLVRMRQTRRRGLTTRSRVRPLNFVEALDLCKAHGARPNFELKHDDFASLPLAKKMVGQANDRQVTAFWMTLAHQGIGAPKPGYSMAEAGRKLRAFHQAGGQTALLAHNFPRPRDLDEWREHVDRIWGRWE